MLNISVIKSFKEYINKNLKTNGLIVIRKTDDGYIVCDNGVYKLLSFAEVLKHGVKV